MPKKKGSPTKANAMKTIERQREVVDLRKQGLTFREIGAAMDLNASTVWEHYNNAARRLIKETQTDTASIRGMMTDELFEQIAELRALARSAQSVKERCLLVEQARKALADLGKLYGANAPDKVEVLSPDDAAALRDALNEAETWTDGTEVEP